MNQHTSGLLYQYFADHANEVVQRINAGESFTNICNDLGVDRHPYGRWLAKNGYREQRKSKARTIIPNNKLEQAYKLATEKYYSIAKISKIIGYECHTVAKRLFERYGYMPLPDGKKPVNDHYFDKIDTPEKAYWLGFFAADGYNDIKHSRLEFTLKDSDKYAVENFKKALDAVHPLSKKVVNGGIYWHFAFGSQHMSQVLDNWGFGYQKTYNKTLPVLDDKLYSHFFRGYIDGDGHIIRNTNGSSTVGITTGSSIFAAQFADYLLKVHDIHGIISQDARKESVYRVQFYRKEEVRRLLDWLYSDSTEETRLKRKYERYLSARDCRPQSNVTEDCG